MARLASELHQLKWYRVPEQLLALAATSPLLWWRRAGSTRLFGAFALRFILSLYCLALLLIVVSKYGFAQTSAGGGHGIQRFAAGFAVRLVECFLDRCFCGSDLLRVVSHHRLLFLGQ